MAASNIPLHCNICPKKPNFSDVSHLLTHIASKGHLSNYYKVKVRSTHEEASRRLIDTYDRWYGEWGVEELMSERMNQKDKRRTRARPTVVRPPPAPKIEAPVPRPSRRAALGNFLDPRLAEQHQHQHQQRAIKQEQSISPSPSLQPTGPVLRHRNTYAPHMQQYWTTESRGSSRSYTNPENETSSEYSDPSEQHHRYRYPAASSCAIADDPTEAADPMAVSESTRLKGVYWPGMDIFDSATPEMRRKRNQKKDSSVVEQLELNSQEVEATELIFTPQGSFKRQRRISCSDSDDDDDVEIKAESPQPRRGRLALANMDRNAPRRPRQLMRPMTQFSSRAQFEEDRSYGLAHGKRTTKRKRFDVFNDDDDQIHFSQPASMNYLTSGFKQPPSPSPAPNFAPYKPYNDPFQFENKENVLPSLQQATQSDFQLHQNPAYHYQAYAYGLGPEQMFQYNAHLYHGPNAYQQHEEDDDDQRTITAPPSPATS
ncbi:hypothetical protein NX059_007485 [Plenodomus lindquistii]|nr:hypothetical protein NX059_007485 [Plenodomus lindquistii]